MSRVFVYDEREFPDPDPAMSVDQVRLSLVSLLPELANAETITSKRDDDDVIQFKRRVGDKS